MLGVALAAAKNGRSISTTHATAPEALSTAVARRSPYRVSAPSTGSAGTRNRWDRGPVAARHICRVLGTHCNDVDVMNNSRGKSDLLMRYAGENRKSTKLSLEFCHSGRIEDGINNCECLIHRSLYLRYRFRGKMIVTQSKLLQAVTHHACTLFSPQSWIFWERRCSDKALWLQQIVLQCEGRAGNRASTRSEIIHLGVSLENYRGKS